MYFLIHDKTEIPICQVYDSTSSRSALIEFAWVGVLSLGEVLEFGNDPRPLECVKVISVFETQKDGCRWHRKHLNIHFKKANNFDWIKYAAKKFGFSFLNKVKT